MCVVFYIVWDHLRVRKTKNMPREGKFLVTPNVRLEMHTWKGSFDSMIAGHIFFFGTPAFAGLPIYCCTSNDEFQSLVFLGKINQDGDECARFLQLPWKKEKKPPYFTLTKERINELSELIFVLHLSHQIHLDHVCTLNREIHQGNLKPSKWILSKLNIAQFQWSDK